MSLFPPLPRDPSEVRIATVRAALDAKEVHGFIPEALFIELSVRDAAMLAPYRERVGHAIYSR
jgi:hypothetical protein